MSHHSISPTERPVGAVYRHTVSPWHGSTTRPPALPLAGMLAGSARPARSCGRGARSMEAFERWDTWDTSNLLLLLPRVRKKVIVMSQVSQLLVSASDRRVTALPASELPCGSERRKLPTRRVRFGTHLPHAASPRTTTRRAAPAHRKLARRSRRRAARGRSHSWFQSPRRGMLENEGAAACVGVPGRGSSRFSSVVGTPEDC